jgi:riboflavin kinase/FMN adenylyltransferase
MIKQGNVRDAVALLGRHFSLGGKVVHGHHRGKMLGFPTANLQTYKELIPKNGVYAVKVKIDQEMFDGACNIGPNPTFDDNAIAIEVFIFEFADDLYGRDRNFLTQTPCKRLLPPMLRGAERYCGTYQ